MIRVLFVIENLGAGGAERVLVNLVNAMDKTRFDVTVMTLFEEGVNAKSLDKDVKLIVRGKPKFKGLKTVVRLVPKAIDAAYYIDADGYDIVIPYMNGVPTIVSSGVRKPKIAWIHGTMYGFDSGKWDYIFSNIGIRRIYKKYDEVVGVSDSVTESYNRVVRPKKKARTLYNTNDTARIRRLAEGSADVIKPEGKTVISTVGCLESSKGYDRLINVCRRLKDECRSFEVWIIGEGRDRKALETQISGLGLDDTVKLLGYQTNPYKFVGASDLFVCSSRTEGLSTAVSEAVILGRPVVSTDVSGTREILGKNGEYGIIVESSEEGIYEGMKTLIDDPRKREYFGVQAEKRAPFFEPENTVLPVEELIEEVLSRKR